MSPIATSTISNTIRDPSGDAVAAVPVIARLKPGPGFRVTEGTEIAGQDQTTTDSNGLWTLALERNSNISPTGTFYEIEEQIPEAKGGPKVWSILVADADATLQASLVSPLPTLSLSGFLTQAAADARYQALGSLGATVPKVRATANATAGIATSAMRSDAVPDLHTEIAGAGLAVVGGILEVDADDSTLEVVADVVREKDDGTTLSKLSIQARGLLHSLLLAEGVR